MNYHFGEYIDASCADARDEEVGIKAVRTPSALEVHPKHPQKKHVQQDVPQAAVQEDVGHGLPEVQPEKEIEWNESEFTIEQPIGGHVEKLKKGLNEKDAGAGKHEIANGRSDEFTPL